MKKFPFLLALLLFLQACSVYHSGSLSVEEAVAAENRVKVITEDEEKYKFKRLEMEDDLLLGITKPRSATAKKLAALPSEPEGRFVQIDLSEVDIEKIKLRNNTLSTIINIATPLVVAYAALLALYVAFVPPSY